MRLFNFPFGPYPQRVTVYLAEKGIADIEVILLRPPAKKGDEWPPDFIRGLSPSGALPIIVDDDGTIVRQSLAILEYLEDSRGGPEMRGKTPSDRARTREIITVVDEALTYFGVWGQYGSRLAGRGEGTVHAAATMGAERYLQRLRSAEQLLENTEFIAGDSVTTADCVAMATLQFISGFYGVPIPVDCVKLSTWYARFSQRPTAPEPVYPPDQHVLALGLMEQTRVSF